DDAVATQRLVQLQQVADLLARAAHAADVRHAVERMRLAQLAPRLGRIAERGAAGAEGHRHELRRVRLELAHGAVELGALLVGLWRVELETDRGHGRMPGKVR